MKLRDYIHYYLHGKIWEAGVSTCTLMGIGDSYFTIKTKQGTLLTISNKADIKLVLRRLEDITKEEAKYLINTYSFRSVDMPLDERLFAIEIAKRLAEQMSVANYLNKQGFDLFGLIDAGLAIDAKTA